MSSPNPWVAAKKRKVARGNFLFTEPEDMEDGVKFFILMLEKLGCTTVWSCEGHPEGFHVSFHGPAAVVREIEACDVLDIELFQGGYSINLDKRELRMRRAGLPFTKKKRDELLKHAATVMVERFGSLEAEKPVSQLHALAERCTYHLRALPLALDVEATIYSLTDIEMELAYLRCPKARADDIADDMYCGRLSKEDNDYFNALYLPDKPTA